MMDIVQRLDAARDFPGNTCPASRHAQMIAEALIEGQTYHMLVEEPEHCGESIGAVVAALYEARTEITRLRAENERLRGVLRECLTELMSVYHSEFDGVWADSDFERIEAPYRAALHHPRQDADG